MNKKQHAAFVKRLTAVQGDRSQRQFALDVGVYQQNVNRYMRGTVPHTSFLIALATVEKISPTWLLLGKGAKTVK